MESGFRIETDPMGEVKLPSNALYGASTQRAVENFPVSGLRFSADFIHALAIIKSCCAEVNRELGLLDVSLADAIIQAANDIAAGKYDDQFVLDVFQTGSGTSTNMNFNEVAANIANLRLDSEIGAKRPVHPNDHVNMGQSSNDIIPTAIHVTTAILATERLLPALRGLHGSFQQKSKEFSTLVKTGRTHLQDATPILLGQEFSGYETQIKKSIERVERGLIDIYELAVGGTAVGTGINTDANFGKRVCASLAARLKLPFREAGNHFEAQAARDACVELSGALKTTAVSLTKIANDLRWLSSGPRCGIGEITLPALQPGSSIMPGKVNPVLCESLLQVCAQVIGNDAAITWGGANGNFELNVMMPLIAHNLLQSLHCLSGAVTGFSDKCVLGIAANTERINEMVERSLMLATPLAPILGYDRAAEISKKAFKEKKSIREVAERDSGISKVELDAILDVSSMCAPGGRVGAE